MEKTSNTETVFFFQIFFGFGWGALLSRPRGFWLGQTPPLKRSFVTFDRGGQTGPPRSNDFFFGAADDTRRRRPSADPIDAQEQSIFFFFLGLGSQAWVPINMMGTAMVVPSPKVRITGIYPCVRSIPVKINKKQYFLVWIFNWNWNWD